MHIEFDGRQLKEWSNVAAGRASTVYPRGELG